MEPSEKPTNHINVLWALLCTNVPRAPVPMANNNPPRASRVVKEAANVLGFISGFSGWRGGALAPVLVLGGDVAMAEMKNIKLRVAAALCERGWDYIEAPRERVHTQLCRVHTQLCLERESTLCGALPALCLERESTQRGTQLFV